MRHSLIPRSTEIWDPFGLLREMREDVTRPFSLTMPNGSSWMQAKGLFAPSVDVKDEKDRVVVKADIPGVKKEDLTVTVKEDLLTLKGERKETQEKKEKDYFFSERFEGSFVRQVELPSAVKAADVKATYKDGVLELILPKDENAKPKEIKVQIQ